MVLTVNGVDLTPYLAFQGLKVTRSDVIGPNEGTALDGSVIRDQVARVETLEVVLLPVRASVAAEIMEALDDDVFFVRYQSPRFGDITKRMYCDSAPSSYYIEQDGAAYWNGISFTLKTVQ